MNNDKMLTIFNSFTGEFRGVFVGGFHRPHFFL